MASSHYKRLALACACSLAILSACSAAPSNLLVFGDSLSDDGNLYEATNKTVPLTPPYYNGMFTNAPGPWAVRLANYYGDNLTLFDLAVGGAQACNYTGQMLPGPWASITCVQQQVAEYLAIKESNATLKAYFAATNTIHTIWGGHNDLLMAKRDNLTELQVMTLPIRVAACVLGAAEQLLAAGESTVIIGTLAPLDLSPASIQDNNTKTTKTAVDIINDAIMLGTAVLSEKFSTQKVLLWDVHSVIKTAVANYKALGFKYNNTMSCLTYPKGQSVLDGKPPTSVCPAGTANDYIFYDNVHPTSKSHGILATSFQFLLAQHDLSPTARRRSLQ